MIYPNKCIILDRYETLILLSHLLVAFAIFNNNCVFEYLQKVLVFCLHQVYILQFLRGTFQYGS